MLLASVSGGVASVEVPVKAGVEKNEGNELVGTLTDIESLATEGGNGVTNFILNVGDGITGFYKAAGKKVAAGKAYLPVADYDSASEAKGLTLVFGGEETGISEVSGAVRNGSEQWYTISGQRVCAPSKGLYIVNGKKVIVK